MRLIFLAFGALVAAYPGAKGKHDHSGIFKALIERAGERLAERQGPPSQTVTKIGNLQDAGTGGTATNDEIMGCFNSPNGAACLSTEVYTPPTKDTAACAADTCCIWSYIKDDLVPMFLESDGTCTDIARSAVRFGFHDAGTWDASQTRGGADGSLLLSPDEVNRPENSGLNKAKIALLPVFLKYRSYGISAADLVQFAHNVAVVSCPLGPRSITFVGRPDWTPTDGENPTGLLPDARSPADVNLDLFGNKTIGPIDLVSLLGAHTSAKQFFFDTAKSGMPLDSTPGVWDVAFYSEVLAGQPQCGVFRLPSDDFMGNSGSTQPGFAGFSTGFPSDVGSGQEIWNGLYSRAYLRLSLLGVADIQGLTDCSKVLPAGVPNFDKPPSAIVTCPASSSVASSSATQPASSGSIKSASSGSGSASRKHSASSARRHSSKSRSEKPTSTCTKPSITGYTSYVTSTSTITKTHTVTDTAGHQSTSCQTIVVTSTEPVYHPFTTATGTLTHVSTITLGSGSYSTSSWKVPVTTIVLPSNIIPFPPAPSTCGLETVTIKEITMVYVTAA